jgi:hypothetical protein
MPMLDTKISEVPAISKILLGVIIGLAIAGFIYALIVKNEGPKATTLTAEQQQNIAELQTATRGDIINDPSGSLQGSETNYYMVRMTTHGADPKDSVYELSPINKLGDIGMTHHYYTDELLRAKVMRIECKSEEWTRVLGLYMGPNSGPDSPAK